MMFVGNISKKWLGNPEKFEYIDLSSTPTPAPLGLPSSIKMPSRSPSAHFLGIELATDQLRASIVDEQLDLVGVESVDFDTEIPEFQ